MAEPEIERQVAAVAAQDEDRLAQFGYKQELKRDWVCVHTHLGFRGRPLRDED